jgi:hypothetical protein
LIITGRSVPGHLDAIGESFDPGYHRRPRHATRLRDAQMLNFLGGRFRSENQTQPPPG